MLFSAGRNFALQKIRKKRQEEKENNKDDEIDVDDIKLETKKDDIHEYKPLERKTYIFKKTYHQFPIFFWIIGTIFLTIGIILLYNCLLPKNSVNRFIQIDGSSVWHYALSSMLLIIGISFFVVAKYEMLSIDSSKNILIHRKLYLFCCRFETLNVNLDEIDSIYVIKYSSVSSNLNSSFYRIGIRYKRTSVIYVFRSLWKYFIINYVVSLRSYILNSRDTYDDVLSELRENINKL